MIEDSVYPFEKIFKQSVERVREEIADRKLQSHNSKLSHHRSMSSSNINKTNEAGSKSKYDLTVDHVKLSNFTQSDK